MPPPERLFWRRGLPALALGLGLALAPPPAAGRDASSPGVPAATSGTAAPTSRLDQVKAAIEAGRQHQVALEAEQARLAQEAQALQTRLVAAAAAEQKQEAAVAQVTQRLSDLQADEQRKKADLARRRSEMAATLSALARLSREPPGALLASPGSAVDALHSSLLLGSIVPELSRRAAALGRELDALAATRAALTQEQASLVTATANLTGERQSLDRLLADKAKAMTANRAQAQAELHSQAHLAARARDLQALIAAIEMVERRRAAAAAAAAAAQAKAQAEAQAQAKAQAEAQARSAAAQPAKPAPAGSTAQAGAAVHLPAEGRLVARFGQAEPSGAVMQGLRIETLPGGVVVSPVAGKVVFAGPFRDYGQLLIIEYGEGYHVLLSGFAHIDAAVGQRLLAGEPVGHMGGENGHKPVLYVELRRKGQPVNPLPWLAARERKVSG